MTDAQQLIQQLADPKQARDAFNALYQMGAAATEPLLAAANHPQDAVRQQVATLLGSTGDSRAIDPLMKLAMDTARFARTAAIASLGRFSSDPRVPDFLRQLARGTGELEIRAGAVFALERVAGKPAARALWLEMLTDPSPQIVSNAASQLGTGKQTDAVEPLLAALQREGDRSLAFAAIVMALGDLGDNRALDPIAAYLQSANPHKRAAAANALGRLGDPRALERLEPLKNDNTILGQEDHGGPNYTLGDTVKQAIAAIRKTHDLPEKKPRWKFW